MLTGAIDLTGVDQGTRGALKYSLTQAKPVSKGNGVLPWYR